MIESRWNLLQSDERFKAFVEKSRRFDPDGFDQALGLDEQKGIWDFRGTLLEAYQDEIDQMIPTPMRDIPAFLLASNLRFETGPLD